LGHIIRSTNKTVNNNLADRFNGAAALPLAFRQAIAISRNIRIRYLWIHSTCIVQDDEEDLAREISIMGDVCSNSFCNNLALSSKNPTQRCFNSSGLTAPEACVLEWPSDNGPTRSVIVKPALPTWSELVRGFEGGSLAQRGWVVQEHHLARRVVHFTPIFSSGNALP